MIKKFVFFIPLIFLFLACDFSTGTTVTTVNKPVVSNTTSSREKWTILIYMSADNNLEAEAMEDLMEMEVSNLSTRYFNVLILLDRHPGYDVSYGNWYGTRMYKLNTGRATDTKNLISSEIDCPDLNLKAGTETELDMSSTYILENAIKFMKSRYKTDHYGLIMWGHGTGWRNETEDFENKMQVQNKAFAFDSTSGTYMSLSQLKEAIDSGTGGEKLDFIGFDTCYGGELEVMYELKDSALYGIGSPGLVMSSGWNYQLFFNALNEISTRDAFSVCSSAVSQFKSQYEFRSGACICIFDLSEADSYFESFEDYMNTASNLITSAGIRDSVMNEIYYNALRYTNGSSGSDVYMDINSLAEKINRGIEKKEIDISETGLTEKKFSLEEANKAFIKGSWSYDNENPAPGIYFASLAESGLYASKHPEGYIKNAGLNQINFVKDSTWYVPSREVNGSLIDKLFYTTSW